MKKCLICNKEFKKLYSRQLFCSLQCRKINKKIWSKKYVQIDKVKEKYKINKKNYRQSEKGKETEKRYERSSKSREYRKIYKQTDRYKKYRQISELTQLAKERHKKYTTSEKGRSKACINSHKRRILKVNGIHEDYSEQLNLIKNNKYFICHWCGEKFSIDKLTLDHVIPLSKGGSDIWENIVLSCKHCNCSKNAKLPEEFNLTLDQPLLFI